MSDEDDSEVMTMIYGFGKACWRFEEIVSRLLVDSFKKG